MHINCLELLAVRLALHRFERCSGVNTCLSVQTIPLQ